MMTMHMCLCMQGTFYGQQQAQDGMASCSFNENRANTMNLSWTTGAAVSLAINNDQYAEGKSCGLCVMYRGRLSLRSGFGPALVSCGTPAVARDTALLCACLIQAALRLSLLQRHESLAVLQGPV